MDKASSLHSSSATAIFVMDPQGRIYIGSHGAPGDFHHSSFLSDQPVSSAGEMVVENGKIMEITNESGHYKPKQSLNDQVFEELEKKGIPNKDINNTLRSGMNDMGEKYPLKNKSDLKMQAIVSRTIIYPMTGWIFNFEIESLS